MVLIGPKAIWQYSLSFATFGGKGSENEKIGIARLLKKFLV